MGVIYLLKQMIIISDGQSNVGPDPVKVAELAVENDIRVNTIGIINNRHSRIPIIELENIAEKGGGICELTDLENLSSALSKVTVKSVYQTIEEVVNNELKGIMNGELKDINPLERNKIITMIDKIGDEVPLKCLILLDTSGSMKNKIDIGRKSILELLMFLEERSGENQIGVMIFPSTTGNYELLCDFTKDIDELREKIQRIEVGGITPTGYAMEEAIKILTSHYEDYIISEITV